MKGQEEKEAMDIFVRDVGMRREGTQKFSNLCTVATTTCQDDRSARSSQMGRKTLNSGRGAVRNRGVYGGGIKCGEPGSLPGVVGWDRNGSIGWFH